MDNIESGTENGRVQNELRKSKQGREQQTGSTNYINIENADKPREKCGVFAVFNNSGSGNAAIITYLGLLALQHRGQESAGMAYKGLRGIESTKGMGLVEQVFTRKALSAVESETAIGHVRYSTTGPSNAANAQPLVARSFDGSGIALAHNGNLTNTRRLYNAMLEEGHIFHSTSDTEIILTYIFRYRRHGLMQAVEKTMEKIEGAYAAVVYDGDKLVAFRDPNGYRPLVIGCLGESYFVASETAALDTVGASLLREVEPGEILQISSSGINSKVTSKSECNSLCIFEYVYFARPDSVINGANVHLVRKAIGALLAKRITYSLDMVVPSPDSGVSAAIGMAEALNIPLQWAVYRNPYLGRTFIEPTQSGRELAVRLKFNPIAEVIKGKKIAVVDDSLVRGTTARILTDMLKKMGAAEVHLCIASPPYRNPCYYGIDIPVARELAALGPDFDKLASSIGADSLTFAEPEDLFIAVGKDSCNYCTACFSGRYPG
ncbi:MAG: amidophosphoribosyltransferase [Firmicutes bacterium]|nr:amidophosphoribosyltransferase [Bacillota bacterium]